MPDAPSYLSWNSNFGEQPTKIGWYATRYSWDSEEGVFADALYWKGSDWASDERLPIIAFAGPFLDETAAQNWADLHNV